MSIRQVILEQIAELLETGEEQEFKAFGVGRGMQAKIKDGGVTQWDLWGDGGQECHMYPEPVSFMYAALCVVTALVDEKEGDPKYAKHTKEVYDFINSPEGKEMCAEAKWKEE